MDNKTLIDILAKKLNLTPEDVGELISSLCESLGECGANLDQVNVPGFGTFEPRKRNERVSVHPASGKRLLIPPKIVLNFKSTSSLKQRVNNG